MGRAYLSSMNSRTVVTNDAAPTAAVTDTYGNDILPLPTGVIPLDGVESFVVDVFTPGGATGNTAIVLWVWNKLQRAWVVDTVSQNVAAPTNTRVKFTNTQSPYGYLQVTLAVGGNPTTIVVGTVLET